MKKLLIVKTISLIMVALFAIGGLTVSAEETTGAKSATVEFTATETTDGIVKLCMVLKDVKFSALQAVLRYNTNALQPINNLGKTAETFEEFSTLSDEASFLLPAALRLDAVNGCFGFVAFVIPNPEIAAINADNEFTVDADGLELYTFSFKKLVDADYGFEIAVEDENKPYFKESPSGFELIDRDEAYDANITFDGMNYTEKSTYLHNAAKWLPTDEELKQIEIESRPLTSEQRKSDVICLQIGKNLAIAYGEKKTIDEENKNVVPYISGERTLVPLRFVAETLGADVLWEDGWDGCVIKKGEKEIKITFGSAEFVVNGETVVYDAPIEVVEERTMVPIRFVSEEFDCDVYWNALNKAVVVSPMDNPWVETRVAEITALNEMLVTILSII